MNTGGGPDLAIVFDSSNPTGGDFDLGTPNETFAGPGIGVGGEMGQPGANGTALGHLLIIAENSVDGNGDGRVDSPDDEAGGGIIKFNFDIPTDVISLQLVDIEETNQGFVVAYDAANQVIANVPMQMLGDNSVQRLAINAIGARRLEVVFPGSGAVSDLELCLPIVSIDIRKQAEGPDTRTVAAGQDVDFEIKVTNTGDTDLTNVVVSDPKAPTCDRVIGNLPAGGMVTHTCTVPAAAIGGGGGGGTMTFKDTFTVHQYNNNEGTASWSGPWIEDDVADGNTQSPNAGNVLIGSNDKLWLDDYPDTGTDPSARRTANLSGKITATLSFDYQTHAGVDVDDAVVAEVSSNGGASYTILETFTGFAGAVTGSRSYDISAFISSQTTIRFRVANLYGGTDETFKVDNVIITGEGSGDFVNQACASGMGAGLSVEDCDESTVKTGPTPTPTSTATNTKTSTPVNTPTNTKTNTPVNTATKTPTKTPTNSPTNTPYYSIDIRKQAEGPDSRTVPAGQDVDFEIKVTNNGNAALTNVLVSDPKAPSCDKTIGNLPAGGMVTYTCTVPAAAISSGGTMTFKDTFTVHQYNNNEGTASWSGPWIEDDVADGNTQSPSSGNVLIGSNDKLWLDDYPDTGTDPSARRTANLSGKTTATLSFDYQTHSGVDLDDAVVAEVSSNGGASYTILETFTGFAGAVTGSRSYDISAFISSQTTIRFRVSNLYGGTNETFKVDNVIITGEGSGTLVNRACASGQGGGQTVEDCDESTVVTGAPCEDTVIEAEHCSYRGDFQLYFDGAASGGKVLKTVNGDNFSGPDSTDRADCDFTVAVAGSYRIRGYVHAATGSDDSFWVKVDGLPAGGILWDTLQNTSYQADFVSDRDGADPVEVYFTAGNHRVTLYKREDGTRIDKLQIVCASSTSGAQIGSIALTGGAAALSAAAGADLTAAEAMATPTPNLVTVDTQRAPTATPTATPVPGDSCAGNCGGTAGSCNCDPKCAEYGDCCHDYVQQCESW